MDELGSTDGYGFDTSSSAGLGDEGTCSQGVARVERNPDGSGGFELEEAICLWRTGLLVLAVGGPIEAGDVRGIADGMQARAAAAAG